MFCDDDKAEKLWKASNIFVNWDKLFHFNMFILFYFYFLCYLTLRWSFRSDNQNYCTYYFILYCVGSGVGIDCLKRLYGLILIILYVISHSSFCQYGKSQIVVKLNKGDKIARADEAIAGGKGITLETKLSHIIVIKIAYIIS